MAGAKTTELIEVLQEMTALFAQHDADHWAEWMEASFQRLKKSDYSGIEKVLAAYGGMGSFNDFVLVAKPEINVRLNFLREKAWQLAMDIKKDHEAA